MTVRVQKQAIGIMDQNLTPFPSRASGYIAKVQNAKTLILQRSQRHRHNSNYPATVLYFYRYSDMSASQSRKKRQALHTKAKLWRKGDGYI